MANPDIDSAIPTALMTRLPRTGNRRPHPLAVGAAQGGDHRHRRVAADAVAAGVPGIVVARQETVLPVHRAAVFTGAGLCGAFRCAGAPGRSTAQAAAAAAPAVLAAECRPFACARCTQRLRSARAARGRYARGPAMMGY